MDNKFDNYEIADISDKELSKICDLEETLKNNSNKDIILIAYEDKGATK